MTDLNKLRNEELIKVHQKLRAVVESEQDGLKNKMRRLSNVFENKLVKQMTDTPLKEKRFEEIVGAKVNRINEVIWPYWFNSNAVVISKSNASTGNITVTQEAPFVWTKMVKTVWRITDAGLATARLEYVDPNINYTAANDAYGDTVGLNVSFTDSQSGRSYFDRPIAADHLGQSDKNYKLPSPQMILPNSNIEVNWFNTSTTIDYFAVMTFFGFRVRLENAQKMLGLITEM